MARSGQTRRGGAAAPTRRPAASLEGSNARPVFYELADQYADALDWDEQGSVFSYSQAGTSDAVNNRLRGLPLPVDLDAQWAPEELDQLATDLDAAFAKAPKLPHALTVYRGFAAGRSFNVGDTFTDPGFFSTTLDREYAERFASRAGGEQVVVAEVELPAGSRVAPLGSELAEYPSEEEIVVPRGATFQVVATEPTLRLRLLAEPSSI